MSEVVPVKPEHVVVGGGVPPGGMIPGGGGIGELGVRESPSGASTPSGTPNNTLVKSSKNPQYYDPLSASASMNQLELRQGGHGGGGRGMYPPPGPQDVPETQSDTNLLNYSYAAANSGGVAGGRGKASPHMPPHKVPMAPGVRGSVRDRGVKSGGEGDGLAGRVLHPPVTSGKERGRGMEQGVASPPTSERTDSRGMCTIDKKLEATY